MQTLNQANNPNRAGVAELVSEQFDFKAKVLLETKEEQDLSTKRFKPVVYEELLDA